MSDIGVARKRIIDAELLARRALAQAGEHSNENFRLRSWLAHALDCRTRPCRTCEAAARALSTYREQEKK